MTQPKSPVVQIQSSQKSQKLSRAQKRFNALGKQIEGLKAELHEWQHNVPNVYQQRNHEMQSLLKDFNDLRIELVELLDRAHSDKLFKKAEKKKIKHLILDIAIDILQHDASSPVKAVHDKYADIQFDEENEMVGNMMKSMVEDMLGIEIDVDVSTPEQMAAFLAEKAREEDEWFEQQQPASVHKKPRQQTAKQAAKEERIQAEQQDIRKSLQEAFRRLAAVLHPDREQDEAEKVRKTDLMKRANVAYKKGDLLLLLELQLEIEQIDSTHINTIAEEQLQKYNKILKEQCDNLLRALVEVKLPFVSMCSVGSALTLTPVKLFTSLDREIKTLRKDTKAIKTDVKAFENLSELKIWLRDYQVFDDFDRRDRLEFPEAFGLMDGPDDDFDFAPPTQKRRATKKKRKKARA